jgi:signal peptidase I
MFDRKSLVKTKGVLKTRILRSKIGSYRLYNFMKNMWVRLSLILIVSSIVVRSFLWQPFAIPSQSMLPTIFAGDYIFVNKSAYGYNKFSLPYDPSWFSSRMKESAIKRGDIIVYRGEDNRNYLKRIIGMPGDRIQMIAGALHINGLAVQKIRVTNLIMPESINSPCLIRQQTSRKIGHLGVICSYQRYKETLTDTISYMTLDLTPAAEYDTSKLVLVPPRYYYVMGDNRDFSLDSRVSSEDGVPNLVEMDHIIGRADMVLLSLDGSLDWHKVWQWYESIRNDRLLKSVNK